MSHSKRPSDTPLSFVPVSSFGGSPPLSPVLPANNGFVTVDGERWSDSSEFSLGSVSSTTPSILSFTNSMPHTAPHSPLNSTNNSSRSALLIDSDAHHTQTLPTDAERSFSLFRFLTHTIPTTNEAMTLTSTSEASIQQQSEVAEPAVAGGFATPFVPAASLTHSPASSIQQLTDDLMAFSVGERQEHDQTQDSSSSPTPTQFPNSISPPEQPASPTQIPPEAAYQLNGEDSPAAQGIIDTPSSTNAAYSSWSGPSRDDLYRAYLSRPFSGSTVPTFIACPVLDVPSSPPPSGRYGVPVESSNVSPLDEGHSRTFPPMFSPSVTQSSSFSEPGGEVSTGPEVDSETDVTSVASTVVPLYGSLTSTVRPFDAFQEGYTKSSSQRPFSFPTDAFPTYADSFQYEEENSETILPVATRVEVEDDHLIPNVLSVPGLDSVVPVMAPTSSHVDKFSATAGATTNLDINTVTQEHIHPVSDNGPALEKPPPTLSWVPPTLEGPIIAPSATAFERFLASYPSSTSASNTAEWARPLAPAPQPPASALCSLFVPSSPQYEDDTPSHPRTRKFEQAAMNGAPPAQDDDDIYYPLSPPTRFETRTSVLTQAPAGVSITVEPHEEDLYPVRRETNTFKPALVAEVPASASTRSDWPRPRQPMVASLRGKSRRSGYGMYTDTSDSDSDSDAEAVSQEKGVKVEDSDEEGMKYLTATKGKEREYEPYLLSTPRDMNITLPNSVPARAMEVQSPFTEDQSDLPSEDGADTNKTNASVSHIQHLTPNDKGAPTGSNELYRPAPHDTLGWYRLSTNAVAKPNFDYDQSPTAPRSGGSKSFQNWDGYWGAPQPTNSLIPGPVNSKQPSIAGATRGSTPASPEVVTPFLPPAARETRKPPKGVPIVVSSATSTTDSSASSSPSLSSPRHSRSRFRPASPPQSPSPSRSRSPPAVPIVSFKLPEQDGPWSSWMGQNSPPPQRWENQTLGENWNASGSWYAPATGRERRRKEATAVNGSSINAAYPQPPLTSEPLHNLPGASGVGYDWSAEPSWYTPRTAPSMGGPHTHHLRSNGFNSTTGPSQDVRKQWGSGGFGAAPPADSAFTASGSPWYPSYARQPQQPTRSPWISPWSSSTTPGQTGCYSLANMPPPINAPMMNTSTLPATSTSSLPSRTATLPFHSTGVPTYPLPQYSAPGSQALHGSSTIPQSQPPFIPPPSGWLGSTAGASMGAGNSTPWSLNHGVYSSTSLHPRFCFPDANVSFLVQNVEYRVHRYFFENHSVYMKELLAPYPLHNTEPIPLVVTAVDFDRLLSLFYPSDLSDPELTTVEEWSSILSISSLWSFKGLRKRAIKELSERTTPVERIMLYRRHHIKEWAFSAYEELCLRGQAVSVEEGEQLGLRDVIKIWEIQQEIGKRVICRLNCCKGPLDAMLKAKFELP